MSEAELMRQIQMAVTECGGRVFRNQSGKYQLEDGRWLASGLCEGASDLIGWTRGGKFLALEVKIPGARTTKKRLEAQMNFIQAVNTAGGIGAIVRSVEEAVAVVGGSVGASA